MFQRCSGRVPAGPWNGAGTLLERRWNGIGAEPPDLSSGHLAVRPGLVGTPLLLPGRAGVARAGAGGWPGRPASGLACGLACDLVLAAAAQALPVCVQMPGPAYVLLHVHTWAGLS